MSIKTTEKEAGEVIICVRDQGPGIAPQHLSHVMERFYRTDVSRQRDTGGTGLGLAIVAEIVSAHDGRVHIESQEGLGACVKIVLPYRKSITHTAWAV